MESFITTQPEFHSPISDSFLAADASYQSTHTHTHTQPLRIFLSPLGIICGSFHIVTTLCTCLPITSHIFQMVFYINRFTPKSDQFQVYLCYQFSQPHVYIFAWESVFLELPLLYISGAPYSGKASDMWALGVVLYTMLFGQFPFYDSVPHELFRKIKSAEFVIPE